MHRLHRPLSAAALLAALALGPPALMTSDAIAAPDNASKASVLAEQAMKFHFGGQPALAIALYRQAYKLDPQPGYLYSAGRAAQKAGQLDTAKADFEAVVAKVPADSPFAIKARARLAEIAAEKAKAKPPEPEKPAPAVVKPAPKPVVTTPPPAAPAPPAPAAPARANSTAWAMLGGGAMVLGGGVLLGIGALNEAELLDSYKDPKTGKYDLSRIDRDELRAREGSYNLRVIGAYGLGGVGLAAAIAGALWLRDGDGTKVSLAPTGRGLHIGVSW